MPGELGEDMSLYSVSLDGRITQWELNADQLVCTDLIDFSQDTDKEKASARVAIEGTETTRTVKNSL